MSDIGGGGDDRRWEGFPGGPEQQPEGPGTAGYDPPVVDPGGYVPPTPPQFPVDPGYDSTAPIPVIGAPVPGAYSDDPHAPVGRSHRAATPDRPALNRYVFLACVAALLVIAGGFLLATVNGDDDVAATGTVSTPSAPVTPTPTPTPTESVPTGAPVVAPAESVASSPTASTEPTTEPSETASSTPSATATVTAVKAPVVILNSTNITGLAKRLAADVEAEGWTVTKTANWTGANVSSTAIYYQPGSANKASAKLFAKKFPFVDDVRPALPGMTSKLTVVLTRDAA